MIIILMIFQGCSTQKNINTKKPKIDGSFEKFDPVKISREVREKRKDTIYITNREHEYHVYDNPYDESIIFYSSGWNGQDAWGNFSGYDYSQNPLIGIFREYYLNNNIKTKGLYCWFGFNVGKWYHFSENGDLISIEDFDEGYEYSMDQIFSYCQKNGIPLGKKAIDGDGRHMTKIRKFKSSLDNNNYWSIQFPDYKNKVVIYLQIDAISGNIVKKTQEPFYYGD